MIKKIDERIIKNNKTPYRFIEKSSVPDFPVYYWLPIARCFSTVRFIVEKFPQRLIACAKATEGRLDQQHL